MGEEWNAMPDEDALSETVAGLQVRNFNPVVVDSSAAALETLVSWIPDGLGVMTGSSTTLSQIGFIDLLKDGAHSWDNWKDHILNEGNPSGATTSGAHPRLPTSSWAACRQSRMTDLLSRVMRRVAARGGYVYGAKAVIWIVGLNKLVPDLETALRRVREYCLPLEDAAMKRSGGSGSYVGKLVLYEREGQPCRIRTILVREALGY